MDFLLLVYLVAIIYLLFLGTKVFEKYKNSSWFFFLIFSVATSIWFLTYIFSYFSKIHLDVVSHIIKLSYSSSIVSLYSFILFIRFFDKQQKKIQTQSNIFTLWLFVFIVFVYQFTPYMISGLYYDTEKQDYYETEGILYWIHIFLSLISLPILALVSFLKIRQIQRIDKLRLLYILFWMFTFYILCFIFVLLLPLFWQRLYEKEVIIFFFPFLFLTSYSIFRYYFSDIRVLLGKIFSFLISCILSILWVYTFKYFLISYSVDLRSFWGVTLEWTIFDIWVCIILFFWLYKVFCEVFKTGDNVFLHKIWNIKENLISISDYWVLNAFVKKEFYKNLNISNCMVHFVNWESFKLNELKKYFSKKRKFDFFINDDVFIEENMMNKKILTQQVIDWWYIFLPIYNKGRNIVWIFQVWQKSIKDNYSTQEISILNDFVKFLEIHLNYMQVYSEIQQLNFDLDRRVDEKTLQYNALISKLKEFIRYASHEIRAPLANSILLLDCINEEFKKNSMNKRRTWEDLDVLTTELQKVSSLVKTIFSAEKYDLEKVKLFMEEVYLSTFLKDELKLILKVHKSQVDIDIIEDLWCIFCDKIQVRELITNLINNALKFSNKSKPKVLFSASKNQDFIFFDIEDNGEWIFSSIEFDKMFDKYGTGNNENTWLWMWLYLCKRIANLHWWQIVTGASSKLWWAKFTVQIPLTIKKSKNERTHHWG